MKSNESNSQKRQKITLLWQFLSGSKRFFLASILAASITALADMIQPQIIRAAVDCAIGGKEGDFPAWVMTLVDGLGGFEYLGRNLWIMAMAVIVVAMFQVASVCLPCVQYQGVGDTGQIHAGSAVFSY